MRVLVPYGDAELPCDLPDDSLVDIIKPGCAMSAQNPPPSAANELEEVRRALREPIGAPRLAELAERATSAVIVVSDITRPCPSSKFLPSLLEELRVLPRESISILFALGTHRKHTREEHARLVGDEVLQSGVRLVDLDADRCVPVGVTSRGTRLEVFRPYLDADLRICTGNIEYHYFAGFSGGAKAVVPGMCSPATIRDNHKLMLSPRARAGLLEGNPVREDIDEAGAVIGIDFLFNVVLDEEKRILHSVAGHFIEAHRAGVVFHDARCDLRIAEAVDVVVTSPGGHPKDMNLYQAHKALDNVAGAVRDGGIVILVARCGEGFGQATFEHWMHEMESPGVLVERLRKQFVVGGHKAAAIARLLLSMEVFLVSEFPPDLVETIGMRPYASVNAAVQAALERCGRGCRVLFVPHGNRVNVGAC